MPEAPRSRPRWTALDLECLRDHVRSGSSDWAAVAGLLGRTATACRKKSRRLGLDPPRAARAARRAVLVARYPQHSNRELASRLGVSSGHVARIRRRQRRARRDCEHDLEFLGLWFRCRKCGATLSQNR